MGKCCHTLENREKFHILLFTSVSKKVFHGFELYLLSEFCELFISFWAQKYRQRNVFFEKWRSLRLDIFQQRIHLKKNPYIFCDATNAERFTCPEIRA